VEGSRPSTLEILKALPDQAGQALSAQQRAALGQVLVRLAAAERVCHLLRTNFTPSFTPKRRGADRAGRAQWWDLGIALKEWDKLANG
jgi:hypothetical protein